MAKLLLFVYVCITSLGLILLKLGTGSGEPAKYIEGKLHFNLNAQVIAGIVTYGVSFILYTFLIAKHDLGYIIPVTTALVYLIIFTASYFIFKETFTIVKVIGITMIVFGVILLNLKK